MNVASAHVKIFLMQEKFSRNADVLPPENMGGDFITIYVSYHYIATREIMCAQKSLYF